jgi:hypothetical protein
LHEGGMGKKSKRLSFLQKKKFLDVKLVFNVSIVLCGLFLEVHG